MADIVKEKDRRAELEQRVCDLEKQLAEQAATCQANHPGMAEKNKDLVLEVDKLRRINEQLEERLEQQKVFKENLREKVKSMEEICGDVTAKKQAAMAEKDQAIAEAVQFREDVAFLTRETTQLLDELQAEQQARTATDARCRALQDELANLQLTQSREIGELRSELARLQSKEQARVMEAESQARLIEDLQRDKRDTVEKLRHEQEEYRKVFDELRSLKETMPRRLEESEREISLLNDKNQLLSQDLASMERELERLTEVNARVHDELALETEASKNMKFENQQLED